MSTVITTGSGVSEQEMFDLSIELIQHSLGKQPVVHLDRDAPSNLESISRMTRAVIRQASRVEFIRNQEINIGGFGGALVYNNEDELIIRVDNALLGLRGSGPMLSKRLLELLQAPPGLFDALNDSVAYGCNVYGIVVTIKP